MIAALYVQTNGCYFGLPDVDPWDEPRDARLYAGPWPVVAHPPCARWCRLAGLVEKRWGHKRGEDGGCFAAALAAVRQWGGVLEHPANSMAWPAFNLRSPIRGRWRPADQFGGWTTVVDQSRYGHRAQKPTWLYAVGSELPALDWREHKIPDPDGNRRRGVLALMGHRERDASPLPFRDLLLSIARSVRVDRLRGTS